ncbi:MAG: alpha/beta hydrolase [bacterium]|nr:alpha/beta hydrolase [bacterium]
MWIGLIVLLLCAGVVALVLVLLDSSDHSQHDRPRHELIKPAHAISPQHQDVVKTLGVFHETAPSPRDVAAQRLHTEELFGREVESQVTPVDVDGVAAEWVQAEGSRSEQRLLYLHGGAFRVGSPKSHRGMTDSLSRLTGASVLAIDYRMLPEHPLMACHEDARKAYRWILENGPEGRSEARGLYVAGDSAGGNLTLALNAWIRDRGLRAPNATVAMAPTTDGTMRSPSWRSNRASDPFLGPMIGPLMRIPRPLLLVGMAASNRCRPNNPEVSPLLGELSGLPPTLIQVSEQELLFDDARRYANKASAAGSPVRLEVWPTLVHVFQVFSPDLPEADEALNSIASFVRERMPLDDSIAIVREVS